MTTSLRRRCLKQAPAGRRQPLAAGISVRDSQGNLRSMSDLFDETIMSLSRLDNG